MFGRSAPDCAGRSFGRAAVGIEQAGMEGLGGARGLGRVPQHTDELARVAEQHRPPGLHLSALLDRLDRGHMQLQADVGRSLNNRAIASQMSADGLLAVLSKTATFSRLPMREWMASMPLRKPSTAASRRWVSSYTRLPSAVTAKPARPRRHRTRPNRVYRSLTWRLTVEMPTLSSSSAGDRPPQSTRLLNTSSRLSPCR